jgi:hypothetical protein
MLPSKARVGDTIHFSFPHASLKGKRITALEVFVNGKKVGNPEMKTTSGMGGGATNFAGCRPGAWLGKRLGLTASFPPWPRPRRTRE